MLPARTEIIRGVEAPRVMVSGLWPVSGRILSWGALAEIAKVNPYRTGKPLYIWSLLRLPRHRPGPKMLRPGHSLCENVFNASGV
jgi:hypothetical protein